MIDKAKTQNTDPEEVSGAAAVKTEQKPWDSEGEGNLQDSCDAAGDDAAHSEHEEERTDASEEHHEDETDDQSENDAYAAAVTSESTSEVAEPTQNCRLSEPLRIAQGDNQRHAAAATPAPQNYAGPPPAISQGGNQVLAPAQNYALPQPMAGISTSNCSLLFFASFRKKGFVWSRL